MRTVYLLFVLLLLYSCSKEKQVENYLVKKDGGWNIDYYSLVYTNNPSQSSDGENVGSFEFRKDHTGTVSFIFDTKDFTWTNTENTLILNYTNGSTEIYDLAYSKQSDKVFLFMENLVDSSRFSMDLSRK